MEIITRFQSLSTFLGTVTFKDNFGAEFKFEGEIIEENVAYGEGEGTLVNNPNEKFYGTVINNQMEGLSEC